MMRCARAISLPTTGWSIGSSRLPVSDATGEQRLDAVADQQIVLEADEEPRLAGIALPSGAAAQLQIDAAALVPVRADHVEAAQRRDALVFRRASLDLPSRMSVPRPAMLVEMVTAPRAPARGDDARLRLVVLRVQHLAGDARGAKARRRGARTPRR